MKSVEQRVEELRVDHSDYRFRVVAANSPVYWLDFVKTVKSSTYFPIVSFPVGTLLVAYEKAAE